MKRDWNDIKNPLLLNFLEIEENMNLYCDYCNTQSAESKELLNKRFVQFYYEVRMISYLSKIIHYEAKKFDANIRKHNQRYMLILDNSVKEYEQVHTQIDELFSTKESSPIYHLEDFIQNPKLASAIKKLTRREKEVLYWSFIEEMKDIEIAAKFQVSQQAISKTKNKALLKLRREFHA